MISKEEAKAGLRKAGYNVVDDNSVITVLIKGTDQMKKTVSAVRELLLKMDYHASFSVRQEAFLDDDDDDLENAFEDVVIDESDMDMLLNEDSVQMSLEDLGLQM
jgi:hypothetical protein